ncbi:hypothetical protein D3273_19860 [Lichenibacterium minor]|jgi:hypothetical protein|uniref:Uncharacterized protein n=1 Tax=Lichenibacterium minor TaxID=2316528 RepID=A0A4Q2U272_9HYPH|nr:hypothetical protein [Lichenibacterium minor]RYC30230.1 hypothetical protein D3273_19860 [Lichenibacterium minor]
MSACYFVQAYKAKGSRLIGQASESYGYADEALAAAKRLARWRAGIVVLQRELDDEGIPRGLPRVLAIHGQVPQGWDEAERAVA